VLSLLADKTTRLYPRFHAFTAANKKKKKKKKSVGAEEIRAEGKLRLSCSLPSCYIDWRGFFSLGPPAPFFGIAFPHEEQLELWKGFGKGKMALVRMGK